MTDDELNMVLDKYFSKKGAWSLFEAICLLEKIDPKTRDKPITDIDPTEDEGGATDYTVRPCKVAIRSIDDAELGHAFDADGIPNLVGKHDSPDEIGAAQYSVDPRKFVAWATAKWPNHTEHLKAAEKRYQDRKRFIGLKPAEKKEAAREEFFRMVARNEFDIKDPTANKSECARTLVGRLTREGSRPPLRRRNVAKDDS
jgi:hypothetical protein